MENTQEPIQNISQHHKHGSLGILLVIGGAFFYSLQSFLMKIMFTEFHLSAIEQFYVLSLSYLVISIIGLKITGLSIYINNTSDMVFVLSRALLGIGDNVFLSIGVIYLSVSTATALYYIFPIITIIMSWTLLQEAMKAVDIGATIFGFSGVLMILKPDFLFGAGSQDSGSLLYMMITLLSALCAGTLFVLYRKTSANINYFIMTFYYGIICSILVPVIYAFLPYEKPAFTLGKFAIAFFSGAITYLGSYLIYKAYQYETASKLSSAAYSQIVFTFVIDYAFFDPGVDVILLVGAGLIVGSSFILALLRCIYSE